MFIFVFRAEDGIRDLVRSRGLGDVYKRQPIESILPQCSWEQKMGTRDRFGIDCSPSPDVSRRCLLYTSDAADDLLCVDLGGRRIITKKKI